MIQKTRNALAELVTAAGAATILPTRPHIERVLALQLIFDGAVVDALEKLQGEIEALKGKP